MTKSGSLASDRCLVYLDARAISLRCVRQSGILGASRNSKVKTLDGLLAAEPDIRCYQLLAVK